MVAEYNKERTISAVISKYFSYVGLDPFPILFLSLYFLCFIQDQNKKTIDLEVIFIFRGANQLPHIKIKTGKYIPIVLPAIIEGHALNIYKDLEVNQLSDVRGNVPEKKIIFGVSGIFLLMYSIFV